MLILTLNADNQIFCVLTYIFYNDIITKLKTVTELRLLMRTFREAAVGGSCQYGNNRSHSRVYSLNGGCNTRLEIVFLLQTKIGEYGSHRYRARVVRKSDKQGGTAVILSSLRKKDSSGNFLLSETPVGRRSAVPYISRKAAYHHTRCVYHQP